MAFGVLKCAFKARTRLQKISIHKNKTFLGFVIAACCINQALLHWVPDSQFYRTIVLTTSISFIVLSTFKYVPINQYKIYFGEKVALVALKLTLVNMMLLVIILYITNSLFYYFAALAVLLSATNLIILGGTLTMLLSDLAFKYKKESSIDFLTGLLNRRYFYKRAEALIELRKRQSFEISIIMLDIDNFKFINDIFGHDVGDKVIKSLAEVLKRESREVDIVSRFGGEEFCLVCPYTDLEGAVGLAERIRLGIIDVLIPTHICDVRFSASFGVTTLSLHRSLDDAIIRADDALYHAKREGKNQVSTKSDQPISVFNEVG